MSSKLHPIYVALDSHQYNRAIKLALALPKTDTLGQALLAHAYTKASQRYKALLTLQAILGTDGFQELQLAIENSLETWQQQQQEAQKASAPTPTTSTTSKKGKKGKKKAPVASAPAPKQSEALIQKTLMERLDNPAVIDDSWDSLPGPGIAVITDETTLATLAVTLQNLKLPLTGYQLYCWAAAMKEDELFIRKAYIWGLGVLASPQYVHISALVLANMQVLALQLARLSTTGKETTWAAQTALWQLKVINAATHNTASSTAMVVGAEDDKQKQRLALLPRLAENLASKCIQSGVALASSEFSVKREFYFLYLRTLRYQSKWHDMLSVLEGEAFRMSDDGTMIASKQQVYEQRAEALRNLKKDKDARLCFEELLKDYPDNWTYWKGHMECAIAENNGDLVGLATTEAFVETIVEEQKERSSSYPLRALKLIYVEMAAQNLKEKGKDAGSEVISDLVQAILQYSEAMNSRLLCAFSDLHEYVVLALECAPDDQIKVLLDHLKQILVIPNAQDEREKMSQLRSYIFAVKLTYQILAQREHMRDEWMPDWIQMIRIWKMIHPFGDSTGQTESLPSDELLLLAYQQLLSNQSSGKNELFAATVLLEMGILHSPTNANFKIAAMDLYAKQNAALRSWDLFQDIYIKHVQLDTCTFLIVPILRAGGLFREIVDVCQQILRLHTTLVRDTGDFGGRAMENGILTKTEEFLFFQRDRMANSIAALEAKGLILDSAPLLNHDAKSFKVGAGHGIVGGDSDFDRATQMIVETLNPYGALSFLKQVGMESPIFGSLTSEGSYCSLVSDNRDLSILSHEILYKREVPGEEQVVYESVRRGLIHNMLVRAALCAQYTKSPKKGKIVKANDELLRCCKSLSQVVEDAMRFNSRSQAKDMNKEGEIDATCFGTILDLCRVLTVVSSGMGLADGTDDNMENREKFCTELITATTSTFSAAINPDTVSNLLTVGKICRILPDCLVPVLAVFRIAANMMEIFGWGKRKAKTRASAAALVAFASELSKFVGMMKAVLESESLNFPEWKDALKEISEFVDENIASQTRTRLVDAQQTTKLRVEPFFEEMKGYWDSFHVIDS